MLETDGKATDWVLTSGLLYARQITRCVNPTRALQAETALGLCKIRGLRKRDDNYEFQKVCRGGAPVKKSDSDYTEINEGRIGGIATREIIVARRVADCRPKGKA